MTDCARPSHTEHPVALGSFRSWMRLIATSSGVDRGYRLRAGFVALTTLLTSPLRLWETARYGQAIAQADIHPAPIFIIGHWRSGTTHLHNLLCQDAQFGYLSTFQAMAPGFCVAGDRLIRPVLAKLARKRYPTRLIDNIPLAFDAPQEDEFAMASLCSLSTLHGFSFPRKADDFFDKYVLLEGLSAAEERMWKRIYMDLVRKSSFLSDGRRLVIKNCAHSARIQTLLALFPEAKFIHIHRNPYEVFVSTIHMHKKVLPRSQLQDIDGPQIEEHVLRFYEDLMKRLQADIALIPSENLVDVRYEELERDPLVQLQAIYDGLALSGFEIAMPAFVRYMQSIDGYKKNAYRMNDDVIEKVNARWAFAFEEWEYDCL